MSENPYANLEDLAKALGFESKGKAEVEQVIKKAAGDVWIYASREILAKIGQYGSLQNIKGIPKDIKKIFVTAFDVTPQQHLQVQAAFQRYTDNSVSKTINLPSDATVEDVRKIYLMAHKLRCKGITIYRYGSKEEQVLCFDFRESNQSIVRSDLVTAESEYSGGCVIGTCIF